MLSIRNLINRKVKLRFLQFKLNLYFRGLMPFPFFKQLDAMLACRQGRDCDPSCLRMIAKHYGKAYSLQTLRDKSYITREGVSMPGCINIFRL